MGVVDMSNNNPPTSRTKDFFASPALSLSLAGIFRDAGAAAASASASMDVEEGDEGSGGGGGGGRGRREDTVEISSENSGPARSRSEDEFDPDGDNDEDGGDGDKSKKKKRKKYHRHTAEQIREMEAYVQITNSFPVLPILQYTEKNTRTIASVQSIRLIAAFISN